MVSMNVAGSEKVGAVSMGTPGGSCFVAGTLVMMAAGTEKAIEDVVIGDVLLGQDGAKNTVLSYDRPMLGDRKLYSFNGKKYFVTSEHPFMTTDGWKSISVEALRQENPDLLEKIDVTTLSANDTLVTINGFEKIEFIDDCVDQDQLLFNFMLDGNNTYYADGYLVHNKPHKDYADPALQENIMPLGNEYVDKLLNLSPHMFEWNEKASELHEKEEGGSFGLSIEDVESNFGDINFTWDDNDGYKRLAYWKFVPLLIEGYKEQNKQINELKELVAKLIEDKS
jgi:hypothetical protein